MCNTTLDHWPRNVPSLVIVVQRCRGLLSTGRRLLCQQIFSNVPLRWHHTHLVLLNILNLGRKYIQKGAIFIQVKYTFPTFNIFDSVTDTSEDADDHDVTLTQRKIRNPAALLTFRFWIRHFILVMSQYYQTNRYITQQTLRYNVTINCNDIHCATFRSKRPPLITLNHAMWNVSIRKFWSKTHSNRMVGSGCIWAWPFCIF